MSRLVVWPLLAAIAVILILVWGRDFFWSHAIIIGLAAAALVYSILRTAERLRNLYRR
ncbi:MAG: hypothetical protein V3R89_02190 [Thermoanaerobaculia bacterium]